jgi:aryl-alcohol dehydrogenase-like predicted oxidoreductase
VKLKTEIALARLSPQEPWIVPMPSTTNLDRLKENLKPAAAELTCDNLKQIDEAAWKLSLGGAGLPEALL